LDEVAVTAGGSLARRLAPWLDHPRRAGVLTDFDGTISAIVDDPDSAVPLPGVTTLLARLAGRYAKVAVISGRPVAYLIERLGPVAGLDLIGLYGLELVSDGVARQHPEGERWRPVVDRVAAAAADAAPRGVQVEHKGLAVTLHARTAPEHAGWIEAWAAGVASDTGLVALPGRRSIELRPPVAADKGTVVDQLATGLEAICFMGDDRGDLPAFAALSRLAQQGRQTLAVAVASDEVPPELLAAADVVVAGPDGVLALLEMLAADG
jgi:trehalose 6-phosphate phosphatase